MKSRKTKPTLATPAAAQGMTPPETPAAQPIVPWLKLEPGTRMKLTCVSSTWLGAQTHWAEGRMKIHTSPTCRWCAGGSPIRFYFFLHVAAPGGTRQYVIQLSAGNMGVLVRARDEFNTLRGCQIEIARRSKAPNSPTTISFLTPPLNTNGLPQEFDIRNKLRHAADWDDEGLADFTKPKETQP